VCSSGGVNSSQAAAIKAALTQTLTLWQGPPGTGKTSTLLHFLRLATLLLPKGEGGQIIASAASNVAVDGLVAGLLKQGVNVVRMGQPAKVCDSYLQLQHLPFSCISQVQMCAACCGYAYRITANSAGKTSNSQDRRLVNMAEAAMIASAHPDVYRLQKERCSSWALM